MIDRAMRKREHNFREGVANEILKHSDLSLKESTAFKGRTEEQTKVSQR